MLTTVPAALSRGGGEQNVWGFEDAPIEKQPVLPLAGTWAFRGDAAQAGVAAEWATTPVKAGEDGWTEATVPGCWEKDGVRATLTGPVWYRKDVAAANWPLRLPSERYWWECDAVSYQVEGFVNGMSVGEHIGMWDRFAWEVPANLLRTDGTLQLALKVEKPGGPRFPVKQTLAGFLPYVWGTWGGPWQATRLRATGPCRIMQIRAMGDGSGNLKVAVEVDITPGVTATIRLVVTDPDGNMATETEIVAETTGRAESRMRVLNVRPWNMDTPNLYTVTVTTLVGNMVSDTGRKRVGFRDVSVSGDTILLNDKPVYFRAPLSWGWYEEYRAPNPPAAVFRAELEAVRKLGFNGVKHCLWIPPKSYFDLADEMGILLWVELPLWLPEVSEFTKKQMPLEYRRIVRQIADHPSLLLWTVGCEIGEGVESSFMADLYRIVKEETNSPLVRDNSGSAECYGGPLPEHADYWDFHLYCDAPQARVTFDSFAPRWRERQPFLFGEFNDQDTLRDLPGLIRERKNTPWWSIANKEQNPQGVRWEYGVTKQLDRMKETDLLGRVDELRESSRLQALLTRKHTLELTRSYPFTSGYVVTGLADTPISTAGIFDDFGKPRFTPEEFTAFNADTVLFIEPDRRRAWTAGGDRPSWLDRYGVWGGDTLRRHIGVSYYGRERSSPQLTWEVLREEGTSVGKGTISVGELLPGTVREIGLIEVETPKVGNPLRLTLRATITFGPGRETRNEWPVWVYPRSTPDTIRRLGLYDPGNHLVGFADAVGIAPIPLTSADGQPTDGKEPVATLVATAWRPNMRDFVAMGGSLLLIQPGASAPATGDGLPAEAMPFFREAMRLFEPHPSWGAFPHEKRTDFCFYGLASDCAFAISEVQKILGEDATIEPVLTRVDARSFLVHAYTLAGTLGNGRFLLTTLRPQGGLGDQPSGLKRHTTGTYLLRTWVDWLLPRG